MDDFFLVKKSQVPNYIKTPLYIHNEKTGYVLYKPVNKKIDKERYFNDEQPNLFIQKSDKAGATNELRSELHKMLCEKISSGALNEVKNVLCEIVSETFTEPIEENIKSLPSTIDIVYDGYAKTSEILKDISNFDYAGYSLVNHSVNVMTIVLSYCIRNQYSKNEIRQLSLCALLHDIGVTKLPKEIVSLKSRLSDQQFMEYQRHPLIGHDIIKQEEDIDSSVAIGILEHHERLDGNGYPRGISDISFEGKLIGLIDSFDNLTNTEKIHRKKKRPFDAMMLIKNEVLKNGCFDKEIYKALCLSLGKKPF